ncbi:hypothetical protein Pmani_030622 [Petrolisthes manimaculis]|uniref:Uncharacterized protein n=1 Tax=Petrolisthes manimaculis TaxID=1843537 RepID=A0AAE1NV94_9EUCA|nr:hypothetical protein Pmani_030622 [Petrolisthes manimaculis]
MYRRKKTNYNRKLPWVLLGLRTAPKEGLEVSPAEMVYDDPLVVPGEFFPEAPHNDDIVRLQAHRGKVRPVQAELQSTQITLRLPTPP